MTLTLEAAVALLRRGEVVAFPTETVYGLGADARRSDAVARIYALKGRPADHPLIVHVALREALADVATEVNEAAHRLGSAFWPGPLTLVVARGGDLCAEVTGGRSTVAVRVPDHPLALALLGAFGGPVAAPSANRFGAVSPTAAEHVRADFGDAVAVLDGGPCVVGLESTIVDCSGPSPAILRPGGVTREAIEACLGHAVPVLLTSAVRVSGQLESHYAPHAEVHVARGDAADALARTLAAHRRVAVLAPVLSDAARGDGVLHVFLGSTAEAQARELYSALRRADALGVDAIVVASAGSVEGLGLALADRLSKASAPRS